MCANERISKSLKKSFDLFEIQAMSIHSNEYAYDRSSYDDQTQYLWMLHNSCGYSFQQKAQNHMQGDSCPKCAYAIRKLKNQKPFETFVKQADALKCNEYEYNRSTYNGCMSHMKIKHKLCGFEFKQRPNGHLNGAGCPKCSTARGRDGLKRPILEVLATAKAIHGNAYEYNMLDYKNMLTKISMTHIECGFTFTQTMNSHINSSGGCPHCSDYTFHQEEKAILYYLKVSNSAVTAYKIGITGRGSVKKRFPRSEDWNKIRVLATKEYSLGADALFEEQRIIKEFKKYKYAGPKLLTSGNTEMFNTDIFGLDIEKRRNN